MVEVVFALKLVVAALLLFVAMQAVDNDGTSELVEVEVKVVPAPPTNNRLVGDPSEQLIGTLVQSFGVAIALLFVAVLAVK